MMEPSQEEKLRVLLDAIARKPGCFYAEKFAAAGVRLPWAGPGDFFSLPFTLKAELISNQELQPPFGTNLLRPLPDYTRFCQTSGSSGASPLMIVDTPESWQGLLECWCEVYRAAGVKAGDRIFFAFSFGPFLGFWTAFEAAARDCLSIPGGGLSSSGRLDLIAKTRARVLCGTPTYLERLGALRRGQAAKEKTSVEILIVAGEPGGSQPAMRQKLSDLWDGAQVFDHHGLTETGPVSVERAGHPCALEILEEHYLAEVLNAKTDQPVADGEEGELILTTLSRRDCPLIRYRTGDLVRPRREGGKLLLEGGILGRADDMLVIRGVNLYPAAISDVLARFPHIIEHQIVSCHRHALAEINIRIEVQAPAAHHHALTGEIEQALRSRFSLRIPVEIVAPQTLPRHELKARRLVRI